MYLPADATSARLPPGQRQASFPLPPDDRSTNWPAWADARGQTARAFSVTDLDPHVKPAPHVKPGSDVKPAILVEDLGKSFGAIVAVDGVNLAVPPATVLGLLGPNGAGKTTIVRILTT